MRGSKMSRKNYASSKKKAVLWNLIMCIFMMGSAVLVPFLRESGHAFSPVYLGLAAVLSLGAAIYALFFESKTADGVLFWMIPLVFMISVAFLLLFDNPFMFPFWTFGGVLLLCAFRLRYGMFLNIYFLFVIGSMQETLLSEVLIVQVLCLLLFGFVMPYAKSWKDGVNILISVAAVLVSVRIVCYFIMDRETLTNDIFRVAVVYAIVIVAVLLLSKALQETVLLREQNESFDFLEELAAGTEEQYGENGTEPIPVMNLGQAVVPIVVDSKQKDELEALCGEQAELLTLFSKKYPKAFLHARRVAIFASEVAERMGAVNTLLVKCGGYYHEIGRLRGEKSVENTLAVAKEENFPLVLQRVLREHTVDGEKPTSKEAALLLLTDNICGMCEHLKKTQKGRILITKVIDRALNLRLTKGDLSYSGLTAGDLTVIRNTMAEVIKEDMF